MLNISFTILLGGAYCGDICRCIAHSRLHKFYISLLYSSTCMKVALINPPIAFTSSQFETGVTPPLSIMYISSYLKQHNIEVALIDSVPEDPDNVYKVDKNYFGRGLSFEKILEKIPKDAELIGITNLFSITFPLILKLSAFLKHNLNKPIVIGGAHVSATAKDVLKDKNIDFVVLGEGEETMLELCKAILKGNGFEKVSGLGYKKNAEVIINSKKTFIENLDSLPFPDRDSINMDRYFKINESHGAAQKKWTPILTSRGCPYSCTFCTSNLWGRRWRARSAKNVVDEIEYCIKKYGIEEFHFEDENLTLNKERIISICNEILLRNIKISWQTPNGIRASVTDREILEKMKKSGCYHITVAPESGSEFVLNEIMDKKQDLQKIVNVIKDATDLKLKVAAFFMMGLPGERTKDVIKTIVFGGKLARMGLDEVYFGHFVPLPGSELYEKLKAKNIIPEDYKGLSDKIGSYSEFISDKKLLLLNCSAYLWFYFNKAIFHPMKLSFSIFNLISGNETLKTERAIRVALKRLMKKFINVIY